MVRSAAQRSGNRFVEEIDRCIAIAAQHPARWPVVYKNLRRITVRRFPYGLYFYEQAQRVVVVAVFHSRRDPAIWQGRV